MFGSETHKGLFFCFRGNDIMTLKQKVTVVKVVFSDDYTQTHTHTQENHSHLQGTSDYIHTM